MLDLDRYSTDYELKKVFIIRARCEAIIDCFCSQKLTIRLCAQELMLSKSLVHYYVHTYIKEYYNDKYYKIKYVLDWNKKYRNKPRNCWKGSPHIYG